MAGGLLPSALRPLRNEVDVSAILWAAAATGSDSDLTAGGEHERSKLVNLHFLLAGLSDVILGVVPGCGF